MVDIAEKRNLAWLLSAKEFYQIECGPARSSFGLAEIYEDTGLEAG